MWVFYQRKICSLTETETRRDSQASGGQRDIDSHSVNSETVINAFSSSTWLITPFTPGCGKSLSDLRTEGIAEMVWFVSY